MRTNATNAPQTNLTLTEAVVQAVNELKATGKFSAHDVTNTIRESVNSGEYALPGLEARPGTANGTIKYWVDHEAVKTVIDTLINNGEMANLGMVNVDYSGAFRVFEFGTTAAVPAPVTPTANATPAGDTDADTQGPVAQRIKAYLANAGTATLKQIQSALKVNGVTCEDFYNLVTALGFDVQPGTAGKFSTYTVSGN
jgi:hypothetical protein